MSYIKGLITFNNEHYPGCTFTEEMIDNSSGLEKGEPRFICMLGNPPHDSPLQGVGDTPDEAREDAAKGWLEFWREWERDIDSNITDWDAIEKVVGKKIEIKQAPLDD